MGESGGRLFSVLLLCYGDYPRYSCRALQSLLDTPDLLKLCDVHVGCNACGPETLALVRHSLDRSLISSAIESPRNLHKDPMLRRMLSLVETPYVLFMDDDSHAKSSWSQALHQFIRDEDPIDVAGHLHYFRRHERYQNMVQQRPWWRGDAYIPDEQRTWIRLCVGGALLARTEFLRRHDWPDAGMRIEFDDVMLADLVYQVGGRLKGMPDELLAHFVINDGDRRWTTEDSTHKPAPAPQLPRRISIKEALQIATAHLRSGRFDEAESACQKILQLEASNAHALHLLGVIAQQTGRSSLAVELLGRAIALNGAVPDFHNNLGNVLGQLGKLEEAAERFAQAIAIKRDYPEAHNNLANVLSRQGRFEEAAQHYQKAVSLKPNYVEAHCNLGGLYRKLGQFDQVIASFQTAVQIDPASAEAYNQLALAHQDQGDLTTAIAMLEKAIALKSDSPQLRFNKALALLMAGQWEAGWREYEWRWRLSEHHAQRFRFKEPLWEGGDPAGKTILLHCEQGLGSSLQFMRYANLLKQRGAKVIVECQPPLKKLLSCLDGIQVLAKGEALPSFDCHLPLMSCPRVFKTTLASVLADGPYLRADAGLVEHWRKELAADSSFKVGIAWQGNPAYAGDRQRSIPLKHYAALAKVPGVRLYSLQKIRGMDQIRESGAGEWLIDLAPKLDENSGPFLDSAAVMKNLDLVITSDTSIAHLAGALAIPVWVALCSAPDWRWLRDRSDCPWYPSMRLFRQGRFGDWESLFQQIAQALSAAIARRQS